MRQPDPKCRASHEHKERLKNVPNCLISSHPTTRHPLQFPLTQESTRERLDPVRTQRHRALYRALP